MVTRQGKEQVVVLPAEQFAQLTKRVRQPKSLVRFFAESPFAHATLDLSRDLDSGREINYERLSPQYMIISELVKPRPKNLTLVTRGTGQIPSRGVAVFNPCDKN